MENNNFHAFYVMFLIPMIVMFFVCSCTLSFQNISTHGVAQDLIDEELTPEITTDIKATIP